MHRKRTGNLQGKLLIIYLPKLKCGRAWFLPKSNRCSLYYITFI